MRDYEERKSALIRFLEDREKMNLLQIQKMNSGDMPQRRLVPNTYLICNRTVQILIAKYSLGEDLVALQDDLQSAIEWYLKLDKDYANPGSSRDCYLLHLNIMSLSVLLGLSDSKWGELISKWESFEVGDRLIDAIIKFHDPSRLMSTELLFESEYAMLLGAYSLDDSTEFLTGISSYLASWYKGHKGCVWFDSHLADGPA